MWLKSQEEEKLSEESRKCQEGPHLLFCGSGSVRLCLIILNHDRILKVAFRLFRFFVGYIRADGILEIPS